MSERPAAWPELPLEAWSDRHATLHMFLQIVGKVRLTQTPWINHSWHATFYVTARGLTTSAISYGRPDVPDRLRFCRSCAAHRDE